MPKTETQEVGFADQHKAALAIIEEAKAMRVTTAQEHSAADDKLKAIRALEKALEDQYKAHPVIIEAKRLQKFKGELAEMLEDARKALKNGPMLAYEQAEEAKRRAEEARLAAEAKRQAEEEAAREAARIAEEAKKRAEIERKRAEAARAEAARAKARGDAEAARLAQEKQAAAKAERERIEAEAKAEAERVKAEADASPAAVIVLPKTTPTTKRTMVKKFRIKDASKLRPEYTMPDEVKIGKVVRALGKDAEVGVGEGSIEVYEVPA